MTKRKISNSESEESESESEEKLSEEEEEVNPKQKQQGISEYEKQRLSRIAENRARMEALGLSKMASSLMGSSRNSSKLKGKRKVVEDDEDYRPGDEDDNDDEVDYNDDKLDGDDDDDEDFPVKKTSQSQSQSRKNKVKNKVSKPKKAPIQKHLSSSNYVDDGDDELMKAIALSLQDSREVSGAGAGAVHTDVQNATFTERKGNARLKRKKLFTSRVQMTEDEMIVHFFQFDGAGKGSISMRDLRRVAIAHDFMWTDKELSDMIHCFDSGGDGKLNLDDFRKIVSRCNMLQSSENS